MNRIVIIEFPSMEHADSFYHSDEYKKGLKYINSAVQIVFKYCRSNID